MRDRLYIDKYRWHEMQIAVLFYDSHRLDSEGMCHALQTADDDGVSLLPKQEICYREYLQRKD